MKFKEDLAGKEIINKSPESLLFGPRALETLAELDKTRENFWNVDAASANFLSLLVKINKVKNALEIGTSNGYSSIWLAQALKQTNGKLTTIEFWDNRLNEAVENFKQTGVNDVITTRLGQAVMILEEMTESNPKPEFDFVFIDANKSEYVKYFKLVDKLLVKGGIIVADNILSHYTKVELFVKEITANKNYQSQLIPLDTGMMLSLKLN